MPVKDDWDITNPPPEGHKDVGMFAYALFEASVAEKERLGLPDRWYENHRLYRGDHWNKNGSRSRTTDRNKVSVNLMFANILRTVANLTSRDPVAEVHSSDGKRGDADQVMSQKIKDWWNESEQGSILESSALNMELYGTGIEKYVPNIDAGQLDTVAVDPFSWFPSPGIYQDVQDMPYMSQAYPLPVKEVETRFGVTGVEVDEVYSLLGEDREDNVPIPYGTRYGSANAPGNFSNVRHPVGPTSNALEARALVIELWIRDKTTEPVQVLTGIDPETGTEIYEESEQLKYPGGIRKITVTNRGRLVLDDIPNPNINPAIPRELSEKMYGWSNFPFAKAVSYKDTSSIWGFTAAEQVDDIQYKIDEILSRIASYINLVCTPPLILPKDCGIDAIKITNRAGLILRPTSSASAVGIRYLQVPNLPSDFFQLLNLFVNFFDRIYAIQDVDRGESPRNIEAASAIITLQERNAVLMRHKIRACDFLVRERGRWAINFYQNFGWREEPIQVQDKTIPFRGTDYAGMQFSYLVESGSTMARTSLQTATDAKELYKLGAIDREALLTNLNFPDYQRILERVGEGQLNQALQILVQAGLPEIEAAALRDFLMQPQGGPGDQQPTPQGGQSQPSIPRAEQGNMEQVEAQMAQ